MFSRTVRIAFVMGLLALATSAVALAGGGSKASTSSISMLLVDPGTRTSVQGAEPAFRDQVTFAVSTGATTRPFVHLRCFQNGSLVLEAWQAWFYTGQTFTLGGNPAWQGGAADCTAFLENWDSYSRNGRTPVLASTAFHVHG